MKQIKQWKGKTCKMNIIGEQTQNQVNIGWPKLERKKMVLYMSLQSFSHTVQT